MGIVSFQYHYPSYTKLPFPPNLVSFDCRPTDCELPLPFASRRRRRCGVHVGPTPSPPSPSSSPTDHGLGRGITGRRKTGCSKEKVVVVVGATGCGKSNLSVDLATLLGPAEVINTDKMQVHWGLDVTTNKIPLPDRRGVPHHLLGSSDPARDLSPPDFRLAAGDLISGLASSGKLPIVAGGSNSLVHALLVEDFDAGSDFFGSTRPASPAPAPLRYDCCFLWVDVAPASLDRYLRVRVDEMLETGMFEELERFFAGLMSGSGKGPEFRPGVGIMKAIGVPEFEGYFRKYPPGRRKQKEWGPGRREAYEEAVNEIKENTCRLARRQVEKILRLRDVAGWDIQRIDATASLEAKMESGRRRERWVGVWGKEVVEPSVEVVRRLLVE